MPRYDEFDTPLMEAAKERVSERRGVAADTPAPRRPGPIAGPRKAPPWLAPALALATIGALVALFQGMQPAAATPAPAYETLNAAPAPTSPWVMPEPTTAPAPTAEPVAPPTAPPAPPAAVEEPAPAYAPQAAPMAPAPVYVPPASTIDIFANPTDLIPDTGLGEREKPCTHPSCEGGQP